MQHFTLFDTIIFRRDKMTHLFDNINDKDIEKLKRFLRASTSTYPKYINILSNIHKDDFIAIIDYGCIDFEFVDYEGNKTILETLNTGSIFGSLTFSLNSEDINCITKEKTQITFIEYYQITNDEILKSDYYIIFIKNIIKLLSEQVILKNNRISLLIKKTTREKLLKYFKMISKETGNNVITLPISYTELAEYLSVDRSAMTRELSYLKEDGLIRTNGRRITLNY